MSELRERFLEAMAAVPAAVHLVTSGGQAGRGGLTVASMCSVSADPPTLLVCINRDTPALAALTGNRCFAVNLLAHGQSAIADVFAGRREVGDGERFTVGEWGTGANGCPVLHDALAILECDLVEQISQGTHEVLFGRVTESRSQTVAPPLLYWRRAYTEPA